MGLEKFVEEGIVEVQVTLFIEFSKTSLRHLSHTIQIFLITDIIGVGSWGEWGEFSTCTETCGPNGRKTRTRVCNCPTDPCKEPCVGESQEIDTCNRTPCECKKKRTNYITSVKTFSSFSC